MGKTYNNQTNEFEVSLGIERLLIAHHPQDWTPARIDIDTMPTGFYDLGAVVEDTPTFTYTRNFFELEAGLPAVTQYRATTGMEGVFACSLHSNSWRKLQFALGNYTATGSFTAYVTNTASLNQSTRKITVTTTVIKSVVFVGSLISIPYEAGVAPETPDDPDVFVTKVTSVGSVAGNATALYVENMDDGNAQENLQNDGNIYVQETPGYAKLFYGGSAIRNYALLGVVDCIDGTQIVHYIPKASPNGDVVEEYRPESNARIPLSFKAFGTRTDIDSCSQIVVGHRYEFPSISTC